jgi:hypothetical protein
VRRLWGAWSRAHILQVEMRALAANGCEAHGGRETVRWASRTARTASREGMVFAKVDRASSRTLGGPDRGWRRDADRDGLRRTDKLGARHSVQPGHRHAVGLSRCHGHALSLAAMSTPIVNDKGQGSSRRPRRFPRRASPPRADRWSRRRSSLASAYDPVPIS